MVGQPIGDRTKKRRVLGSSPGTDKIWKVFREYGASTCFCFLQGTDPPNACIGNLCKHLEGASSLWLPTPLWWADRLIQGCTLPSTICSWDRLHDPKRDNVVIKREISEITCLTLTLYYLDYHKKDLVTNVVVHGIFLQLQGLKCSFLHLLLQTEITPYDWLYKYSTLPCFLYTN